MVCVFTNSLLGATTSGYTAIHQALVDFKLKLRRTLSQRKVRRRQLSASLPICSRRSVPSRFDPVASSRSVSFDSKIAVSSLPSSSTPSSASVRDDMEDQNRDPALYMVTVDIKSCFDRINRIKLFQTMRDILQNDEGYFVEKFFHVRAKAGTWVCA